ncbi:MAG TPA: phosphoribosylaminoimidazolesuccinocarboxamide synthase [Bacteroidota bacterium]|nr:phosphoribosylaminoimidazolesuccinocarboxamide synthase [Bacteroidota bacterium]
MAQTVISSADLTGLSPAKQGKVRDMYDLGQTLLIVATDRLSAFDVILPDGIPNKGKVLTQISAFWFRKLARIVDNHLISTDIGEFPEPFRSHPEVFAGRSMVVRKTRPLPVECIARGYLSGSGWTEYSRTGAICGVQLPPGLKESDRLPAPVFTPTTKAEIGTHDENITFEDVVGLLGEETARRLRDLTLSLYSSGAAYAAEKGIIIADTKFEFGVDDRGAVIWIDEALTPDSSRFWPMDLYAPGGPQPSFDKQYVRDFLLSLRWDKKPPAPRLPDEVIRTTAQKYEDALLRLAGKPVE